MRIADDGGGGAPQIGDKIGSIFDSMNSFAKMAADGSFEVSSTGGKALLDAINGFQDWVESKMMDIDLIAQERKLGTSNGAKVMAPFAREVATDGQGFGPQLKALQLSLNKAKEGIEKAMKNYQETEQANQNKAKKFKL